VSTQEIFTCSLLVVNVLLYAFKVHVVLLSGRYVLNAVVPILPIEQDDTVSHTLIRGLIGRRWHRWTSFDQVQTALVVARKPLRGRFIILKDATKGRCKELLIDAGINFLENLHGEFIGIHIYLLKNFKLY
jgi:hypothetical protein